MGYFRPPELSGKVSGLWCNADSRPCCFGEAETANGNW